MRLIALFRDALALGLVPEHHDRLYGLAADPAMLLDRKAGWRPGARQPLGPGRRPRDTPPRTRTRRGTEGQRR